jgi:hypothetical protein
MPKLRDLGGGAWHRELAHPEWRRTHVRIATHRENRRAWLEPLTPLEAIDRILTTHGSPVLQDGRAALTADAVDD